MTFALASIKMEFALNTVQAGTLGSMTFLGMLLGASSAGILCDRFGRCKVFQWSMVIWGIASLLCAFVPNIEALMACRVLLGIGMAMEPIAGLALVCEFVPASKRGRYLSLLEGMWPVGFISAGLLAYFLIPIAGWRSLFLAEAIPAIFVFFIRRYLPESPRWLMEAGRPEAAEKAMLKIEQRVRSAQGGAPLPEPKELPASTLVASKNGNFLELWKPGLARRTVMLWSLWFFALLGFYGLTTWLGELLTAKGYGVTKSNLYIVLVSLSGVPAFFALSRLVESWGRKACMIATLLGSAGAAYLYGNASNLPQLICFGLVMQFFMYGIWCSLYAITPELYPTNLRATGAGFASAAGRLGALIGPYVVGVVLPIWGQSCVFSLGAGAFVLGALVVFLLAQETKGKTLEQIS